MDKKGSGALSEKLEQFFDSGTVILFTCEASKDFPLLSVSENSKDILGFEASYFVEGENGWSERIHPSDKEGVLAQFRKVLREGGSAINEYRFKKKDGSYIWLRDELKLISDSETGESVIYGSCFDITERKRTELALKENKEQYQSVLEHIKDVTYTIGKAGRLTFLNSSWKVRTGYQVQESLDEPLWKFVHPKDKERFKEVLNRVISGERESETKILRFLKKEGGFYWGEVYAKRLQDKIDESSAVTGTIIDVSEDIARYKEKEVINEELEERVQQRSKELKDEIEKRKEIEQKLQQRLIYEQAISKCSGLLLKSMASEGLEESLEILLEVSRCDRVYMYKNMEVDGELYMQPVADACAEGVESAMEHIDEGMKYSEVEWWQEKLSEGEIINDHVENLPDSESEILTSQNVKSVLVIPLKVGGEWYGYIGFANTREKREWSDNEVQLLNTAADIIAAFERWKIFEKSLVEQRNYTKAILDSLPSIYLLMDEDYQFVEWNSNAEQYTGYSSKELEGKRVLDLIASRDHEKFKKAAEQVEKHESHGTELTLVTKSGEEIPYFLRGNYIELEQEMYFLCVGLDITKQKQTESQLKEEKRFNQALIESLPGVFYMLDEEGNYLRWNDNFEDNLGYDSEEISQLKLIDLFEGDEYQRVTDAIQGVFKGEEANIEAKVTTGDGEKVPYYLTGKLLENNNNKYLIGAGYDISEQKEAREQLKESEELFRNLFLKAPAALVMTDPENKVLGVNNSFEDLFGYKEEEIRGKDIDKVLVPVDEYEEAPKMPGNNYSIDHFQREATRITKGGDLIDVYVGGIPVHVNGAPLAGFGMYIDITEQKKYEEEIYTSLKEKHVLLQEIHHRVKNNLAVISGLLQLQMYESKDPEVRDILLESQSRIQTMALIHEKLYQSQNLSRISCKSYLGELIETIRSTNDSGKNITVDKSIEDVQLNINKAVPFALLVNEVVTNAFKHAFVGREEGEISISLKERGNKIHALISDNGIGLPKGFKLEDSESLGMTLIHNFMVQLEAEGELGSTDGTYIDLTFDISDVNGSSDSGRLLDL